MFYFNFLSHPNHLFVSLMSFRPLFRSFGHNFKPLSLHSCRSYASSSQFATIQTCPSPTCACSPTPSLPDGVKIDRKVSLNGIMPSYAEQVVICTGKSDWKSKIEEENDSDNLAQDLKELLGRGGKYSDVHSLAPKLGGYNLLTASNNSRSTTFLSSIRPSHPPFQHVPKCRQRQCISFQASNMFPSFPGYPLTVSKHLSRATCYQKSFTLLTIGCHRSIGIDYDEGKTSSLCYMGRETFMT